MTRNEKINLIIKYYDDHFKFQKFVYDQYIDRKLVEKLSDEELDEFIKQNCK